MITGNEPAFADPARGAEQSFENQSPMSNSCGLTIRQEFARSAMQGLLANPIHAERLKVQDYWIDMETIAQMAVEASDHLIAELNKETK